MKIIKKEGKEEEILFANKSEEKLKGKRERYIVVGYTCTDVKDGFGVDEKGNNVYWFKANKGDKVQ